MCSVQRCKNRLYQKKTNTDGKITYYKFPEDPILKEKWIKATDRGDKWLPKRFSKICSLHFEKSCFVWSKNKLRKSLIKCAVPTLNLHTNENSFPSPLESDLKKGEKKEDKKEEKKDDISEEASSTGNLWFMQNLNGSCALLSNSSNLNRSQPFYVINEIVPTIGDALEVEIDEKSDSNENSWLWQDANGSRTLLAKADVPLENLLSSVKNEDINKGKDPNENISTENESFCANTNDSQITGAVKPDQVKVNEHDLTGKEVKKDETELTKQIAFLTRKNAEYKKKIKRLEYYEKKQKKRIAYLEYILNSSAERTLIRTGDSDDSMSDINDNE